MQRVLSASVEVEGKKISSIGKGLLVFFCVMDGDTNKDNEYITKKLLGLRIFPDEEGKMNLNISSVSGSILLVSQFTLAGDVRRGMRPDFSSSAKPDEAILLMEKVVGQIKKSGVEVFTGEFGADMKIELINDGPVTILLDSRKEF